MSRRGFKAILILGTFLPVAVVAQPAENPATLRQALTIQARQAMIAGDHSKALSLATQAGQIRMSPSLRLFIAQEQNEIGQLAPALSNAELCVFEATKDKALKKRKEILRTCKDLMAHIQKFAGRITVSLPTPVPPQVRVLIGSQEVEESLFGRPYPIRPGAIHVEATAPGCLPYQRELEIEAGDEVTVTVSLPPDPDLVQTTPPPVASIEPKLPTPSTDSAIAFISAPIETRSAGGTGPYFLAGAGAATLSTSGVLLLLRNSDQRKLATYCGGPNRSICTDTPEARSLHRRVGRYNTWTSITLGVGAAALIGGSAWWLYTRAPGGGSRRLPTFGATLIRGGAGIEVQGGF